MGKRNRAAPKAAVVAASKKEPIIAATPFFPQEIIEAILLKLPVKSLSITNLIFLDYDFNAKRRRFPLPTPKGIKVIGSINGLLCVALGESPIVMWNSLPENCNTLPTETSLKELPITTPYIGTHVNGSIYWYVTQILEDEDGPIQLIACFDLKDEKFRYLELPHDLMDEEIRKDELPDEIQSLHTFITPTRDIRLIDEMGHLAII
ncbi:hypothetical protein LguiA_001210 [Lonicera macranthoides]